MFKLSMLAEIDCFSVEQIEQNFNITSFKPKDWRENMPQSENIRLIKHPTPPYKQLRVFAFDPILSRQIESYEINEVTIKIPWDDSLKMGPVDSYFEVVDYDPASHVFYAPVNLNDPKLLGQNGLSPSESNPQFHQQMAYAVARTTVDYFEQALGRKILWSIRLVKEKVKHGGKIREQNNAKFIERLRIYPHAIREANAYYSPEKKALLFGYFPASLTESGQNMPGETVFTCLSHDIVAHETTHAIIDGLHPRFIEPSNVDVWALHEALADVVALFQHFAYPEVLKHQIVRTRGDLESQNLLGELAFQFGQAIGNYGALRSAIGEIDSKTKKWIPSTPDPMAIMKETEPHKRGAILVAAIFDAFLAIYKSRIRDLLRIASGGTGVLQPGELHPDLVERLAQEAAKTARQILQICIRALDYCPPVDINFGDYLRALITADAELVTDDRHNYRLAIIEAFRRRGIYPQDIRNLSVESLLWNTPTEEECKEFRKIFRSLVNLRKLIPDFGYQPDRQKIFNQAVKSRSKLHRWFVDPKATKAVENAHLMLKKGENYSVYRKHYDGLPSMEVHSVRPAHRIGPNGETVTELVIEVTQRRRGYFDEEKQKKVDVGKIKPPPRPDFIMRGGCTILVDLNTAKVRYCICKDVMDENRLKKMREFLGTGFGPSLRVTYFGDSSGEYYRQLTSEKKDAKTGRLEPFALLHRSTQTEEET
jgi:hypothetical protein